MTASAPSKTAVATSDTSARVGTGAEIIDSSIWVATTTGLPARRQARISCFCRPGTDFQRHFDAEVAAGNHQRVGEFDDLVDALDRLRLLDLRHQADAAARDLADFRQIFRALDEGQRNPVDIVGREHGIEIGPVLLGQRADAEQRVGQADALAVGNLGAGDDGVDDALAVASFRRADAACRRRSAGGGRA